MPEDAFHDQRDVVAGALDIYKCFDQIVPLLVEVTLSLAGCPWQVLGPYRDMMRGVRAVNMLPQGAGEPYQKRCSIPQGCPFSMMITALLLRPWILARRASGLIPRILADDLLLVATDQQDAEDGSFLPYFVDGMQHTIDFIHSMGGRVSFGRCVLMATSAAHRADLRGRAWGGQYSIPVRHHMRDLGAHLSFSGGGASITLSARSGGAGLALDKIKLLPVRHKAKLTLVRGKAYAMGLYGVEATPLNVATGSMLRSKAASAIIGKHQSMRAPEAVLARGQMGVGHLL
jgi:hypothetical protein